jgi:hypothetical protein
MALLGQCKTVSPSSDNEQVTESFFQISGQKERSEGSTYNTNCTLSNESMEQAIGAWFRRSPNLNRIHINESKKIEG